MLMNPTSRLQLIDPQFNNMGNQGLDVKSLAMIGCGSMGGGMALLFAEKGFNVLLQDPSTEAMDGILKSAKKDGIADRMTKFNGIYVDGCNTFPISECSCRQRQLQSYFRVVYVNLRHLLTISADYASLCSSLDTPKVFVWSLPHGNVGDTVLDGLLPYLQKGDIIIDCGNEYWQNTERRQGSCVTKGIR